MYDKRERTVAIYARVSTEHEAQVSALENQVQYYDQIMNQHPEWVLYDKYIDEGITGTSVKKRKNFLRMMEDAENHKFDLIITREVSRFARNTVDTLQETRKLKKIGVEVWFTEDNIWTMNDEDGELRLTIMATLAQNESKKTSMRVKAGQHVSFLNAVPYGNGNVLGYDRVGKELVINPEQAATVKRIYELYLSGAGEKKISYTLEQEGRKTATGLSKWECANIGRILQNPFYCGIIVYRKQFVTDYLEQKKINNHGEVEKVTVEGKHEPIVSKEDFYRVQEMFEAKRQKSGSGDTIGHNPPTSIWSKKMICCCGGRFNRRRWNKSASTGLITHAYYCRNALKHGSVTSRLNKGLSIEDTCDTPMVQEWKLQLMAETIFEMFWNNKQEVIKIANDLLEDSINNSAEVDENYDLLVSLENKIKKVKNKLDNLVELRISEEITRDYFLEKREELDRQIQSYQDQIEEINKKDEKLSKNDLQEKLQVLKYGLEKDFQFDKYHIPDSIIDAFVKKIVVHKDYFEWHLVFDNDNSTRCLVKGTAWNPTVEFGKLPVQSDCRSGSN